jgi:hypothetical protein
MTLRRIYLRAGLYAEGTSDYDFLLPLLDRLMISLSASLLPGVSDVVETLGIDAPEPRPRRRAEQIAAAVADSWDACTLFVIHADGAGDPDEARRNRIDPGIEAGRSTYPEIVSAACIPVRETEAWMLADAEIFRRLLGSKAQPVLPAEPERDADPKVTLRRILREGGIQREPERLYRSFGEQVRFEALRTLPAFLAFERELSDAVQAVAQLQRASQ